MFKSQKSKGKKSAKSKKLSKRKNLPKFDAKETRSSFLTSDAKTAFNSLQLAFTKALILKYFDLKCYIQIRTDVLSYAISDVLSELASGTKLDRVIIKTDLSQWHWVAFFSKKTILTKT